MAWLQFATLTSPQPLSDFDTTFAQVATQVTVSCTAVGTNTITLTPTSNAPTVPAYSNGQRYSFVVANAPTGLVNLQVGSLPILNLYSPGGTSQVGSGGLSANQPLEVTYQSSLNAGAGGFVIVSALPSGVSIPVTVPQGGTGVTSASSNNSLIASGTSSTNPFQFINGVAIGRVLTDQGPGVLPAFLAPSTSAGLIQSNVYSSTQTITIPTGVTKAIIWLVGGGAGGNNTAGAGGVLRKTLTGLTAGNTLALTIGAGGPGGGGAGGNSILASGTQVITTLTAAGGGIGALAGGGATNGDLNFPGGCAGSFSQPAITCIGGANMSVSGSNVFAGAQVTAGNTPATIATPGLFPGGAGTAGGAGAAGLCFIDWFA